MSKLYFLCFFVLLLCGCSEQKINLAPIEEHARSLLEMQSCEYIYHDIIYQGHMDKILGLITSTDTRLLFSVNLVVKAGVVLDKKLDIRVVDGSIFGAKPTVKIFLPEATVISINANPDSIRQYFLYEYGLFGDRRVRWLDVQDEVNRAKERARADATKRGILAKAWDNSATVLKNLLHLAGFENVSVEHILPPVGPANGGGS